MKRYFFDLATNSSVQFDYKGREFERMEQVREIAELFALDIECTMNDGPMPLEVQVRNIDGQKLFCIPIRTTESIAA